MTNWFHNLFPAKGSLPQGQGSLWSPVGFWLQINSDAGIALACLSVASVLFVIGRQQKDVPRNRMVTGFALFTAACGAAPLMEICRLWPAASRVAGAIQVIATLTAMGTAIWLLKFCFRAFSPPNPSLLRETIAELAKEIDELEQRVREQADQLAAANQKWEVEMAGRWDSELALARSQQLLQAMSDYSPAIIYIKDVQGRYLLANRGFSELFQVNGETIVGKTDQDIFPRETAGAFQATDRRVVENNLTLTDENVIEREDGPHTYRSVKRPLCNPDGKPCAVFGISTDVTERKQFEERLEASFKKTLDLQTALDEHAIVAITDPQGRITHVNEKFCQISKYLREELIGQDHRLINSGYHPKEFIRSLWHTITHGQVWHGEMKNRASDGSFYWVDTTIVPFLNDQNKPSQYVAIRTDITERKRAEAEILQLNAELEQRVARRTAELEAANRELESFSYSISHDLRAPLRAVNGFAGIALEDFGSHLPEEGRRHLERVRNGAQRMGELIDDLLSFSRLSRQPVNRQTVNTPKLVQDVLDELAPQRQGRPIEIRIGPLADCPSDPVLLKQVWINLISNAIKYTRDRNPAIIVIGSAPAGGEEVYFVRDNGTGFDMRYADKLFGVFQRLHRADEFEGTGVGLAIVQRIIHRHGGRVWAVAEVGRGATFSFTLEGENKT
jgi:PAS domain S-box-containing protein